MVDIAKADMLYKKHKEENPHYDYELVMGWKEEMPKQFALKMFEDEYGCHIFDADMYEEAVTLFDNKDGSKGAHWDIETIKSKSGIDFDSKDYTLYDYAYITNMLYSDFSNVFTETSYYLKMAKSYLEDSDYYSEPSERAYHDAKKRIEYFE